MDRGMRLPINHTRLGRALGHYLQLKLQDFRHQVAQVDALPQLAILGLVAGFAAASLTLIFRWTLESLLSLYLHPHTEAFEQLNAWARFFLPLLAALAMATLLTWAKPHQRKLGIGAVIEGFHLHQGRLPLVNTLLQFVLGLVSLGGGLSAGREGPSVHLGAGIASTLGQSLALPNNSLRLLIGCGTAASIAAAFNTPLAGVIFAMEVVMAEYSVLGFAPIIIAAITGAVLTQMTYGAAPIFSLPALPMLDPTELGFCLLLGVFIGLAGASFQASCRFWQQNQRHYSLIQRGLLVGLSTGTCALIAPQVMGMGYDALNLMFAGGLPWLYLLLLVLGKGFLTSFTLGMGLPIGMIAPLLVIGGGLGALGAEFVALISHADQYPSLYVLIGMGAMMGSVLQAPLAALLALLELTHNPQVLMPSMLTLMVAFLIQRVLFKQNAIFISLLNGQGIYPHQAPLAQALGRTGVMAVMDRRFVQVAQRLTYAQARQALIPKPHWLVIQSVKDAHTLTLMPAAALAHYLQELDSQVPTHQQTPELTLDLARFAAPRLSLTPLSMQASLQEADQSLQDFAVDALVICPSSIQGVSPILGILTRDMLEQYYR
ncbi:H+/Cl-antiporter ClcA [Allopseudospirillum japonicum]|uniref:H+/Cl-antiporter ClcA n=1 Tax=Allopseudospirillum japonicum TaxID=64971 RepID=A0A1H6TMP4_9GAMM|nr:chloride channel protein [Allopseudospirillum japonicum]SEI81353.1 H+/Cl-antiporter ClcA [Allopseudospirillum japonicum]